MVVVALHNAGTFLEDGRYGKHAHGGTSQNIVQGVFKFALIVAAAYYKMKAL